MAHEVKIQEIINGVQITETIDADIVVKLISYQSKPFLRTTNESAEETYQVLDIVGEIYNTPALATDFRIIDKNGAVFIPANGIQLIEYSKKIRAFRPEDDGFSYHIGEITGTSNSITIGLADDNVNWAYIDGSFFEKYYPDTFNFTPVDAGETKTFLIYAKADSQTFYLTQNTGIPPGTYLIASVTVNESGINIEEVILGFKEKANDGWRYITLADNDPKIIEVTASPSHSFNLQPLTIANEPKIVGIKSVGNKNTWDGNELLFFIDGDSEVTFLAGAYDEGLNYVTYAFAETVIGKPYTYMRFKRKNWYYHHIPAGGGASFPEGTNGQILELDSTAPDGVKWVDKIKGVAASFLHYWNGSTWLSSGVEFISNGIIKVKSIILTTNSGTALPDELGYDGTNVFFGNTKRKLAFVSEDKTGTFNPPTLAQLASLGITKNDFYVNTSTHQRAMFNGVQLQEWTVTTAEYNALSTDQKNAVKNLSIIVI